MKRWINTKVVIDILTGKVLEREGYWYDGKLALCTTPPTVEVTDWAFYDDGTEAGSVIIGSKNTNPTLDVDTIYLVRFGVEETSGNSSKNTAPQLQYNHNSGGWNNVTATSAVVQSVATANIADGADTTQRMTAFTYDSTNEFFDEVNGIAGESGKADLASNGAEALFSVQILSGDVANNDTIVLRVVDSNNSDALYDVYNQTDPTVTVNEGATAALFAASITGTATVAAALTTAITAVAAIAASAVVAGVLTTAITVAGATSAQGTVAGALTSAITLKASITAQATTSGTLFADTAALLAAAITGSATQTGALTTEIKTAGALSAQGTIAGALATAITPKASISSQATITGTVVKAEVFAADVTGTGTLAGALTTAIPLAGAPAASGSVAGALTTEITMAASINATATVAASLTAPGSPDISNLHMRGMALGLNLSI